MPEKIEIEALNTHAKKIEIEKLENGNIQITGFFIENNTESKLLISQHLAHLYASKINPDIKPPIVHHELNLLDNQPFLTSCLNPEPDRCRIHFPVKLKWGWITVSRQQYYQAFIKILL